MKIRAFPFDDDGRPATGIDSMRHASALPRLNPYNVLPEIGVITESELADEIMLVHFNDVYEIEARRIEP